MRLLTIQPKNKQYAKDLPQVKLRSSKVTVGMNVCNKTNHRYPHQTSQIKYRVGLTIKHPFRPVLHILHINSSAVRSPLVAALPESAGRWCWHNPRSKKQRHLDIELPHLSGNFMEHPSTIMYHQSNPILLNGFTYRHLCSLNAHIQTPRWRRAPALEHWDTKAFPANIEGF